jgi:putative endonuclease
MTDKEIIQPHYVVYMLRTSSNTLYTGQTNNLKKRLEEHTKKKSRSAKYMKAFESFTLVYTEMFGSRKEAMQREYELKQLTKAKKELLISLKTS